MTDLVAVVSPGGQSGECTGTEYHRSRDRLYEMVSSLSKLTSQSEQGEPLSQIGFDTSETNCLRMLIGNALNCKEKLFPEKDIEHGKRYIKPEDTVKNNGWTDTYADVVEEGGSPYLVLVNANALNGTYRFLQLDLKSELATSLTQNESQELQHLRILKETIFRLLNEMFNFSVEEKHKYGSEVEELIEKIRKDTGFGSVLSTAFKLISHQSLTKLHDPVQGNIRIIDQGVQGMGFDLQVVPEGQGNIPGTNYLLRGINLPAEEQVG